MKSTKIVGAALAFILAAGTTAAFTGCGESESDTADTTSADTTAAEGDDTTAEDGGDSSGEKVSGTVATDGSTSMEKVIGFLSEDFMNKNPDCKVTYNPTGSGAGIQAVSEGRCDIGLASRDLKDDETANLEQTVVAYDGIAMVVNPQNTVDDLKIDDIAKIYTGEVTNWKDLGGADAPIVKIGREAASGTRDGFESVIDVKDKCKYDQELTSTGDVIQTVASNPNAIGYASLAALNDTIKACKVEGVEPTEDTVLDKSYKIQRDFNLITPKGKELSAPAKAFYDYCLSDEVKELISKAGAVPVEK